eukprot:TRINITY_DN1191_c0_g1_i2.p3 TRINITY_DN1191_c0_g1~~TRINITY_DN1191_c0_g1_i2.p3  ORF type:complete len:159 (+),score=28.52 TRINITY_DN1191_c0_g1_i2:35-478(+)
MARLKAGSVAGAKCSRVQASFTSSSRRKSRKAHFQAPSHVRRVLMSAPLSKELRAKYHVRALPIHREDEVRVKSGQQRNRDGKVQAVYRKRWCIYVDKLTKQKNNGQSPPIPIHPSNVEIVKLKIDKIRRLMLARKDRVAIKARSCA